MEKPEFLRINLKRRMDAFGWSFKKLALESGVSYHTIFRAVSEGKPIRMSNVGKLARALKTTISQLLADPALAPSEPLITLGETPVVDFRAMLDAALKKNSMISETAELLSGFSNLSRSRQALVLAVIHDDEALLGDADKGDLPKWLFAWLKEHAK